jgi:tRNA nucleotidyltransferase (CCA-adding enzyme)
VCSTVPRDLQAAARQLADAEPAELVLPAYREMLSAVLTAAEELDHEAFLVGGIVRDLLLGRPHGPDVDVVVVGDAAAVARAAARRLGGSVRVHDPFGTATWQRASTTMDVVTARRERYVAPGRLPLVVAGTIEEDLARRDFAVNAIALPLRGGRSQGFLDPHGGLEDLVAGRLRVLHPASFQDDPTRILRAARYASRLGFDVAEDTAALIPAALPVLAGLSAARLRAELIRAFAAPPTDAAAAIDVLAGWSVIEAVVPGLGAGPQLGHRLHDLGPVWSEHGRGEPRPEHGLALWLVLNGSLGAGAARRLNLTQLQRRSVEQAIVILEADHPARSPSVRPSRLFHALHRLLPDAVALAEAAAGPGVTAANLRRYAVSLAATRPPLDGHDLAELGLAPGALTGRVLEAVRDAWLDGEIRDRAAALDFAQSRIAAWTAGEGPAE